MEPEFIEYIMQITPQMMYWGKRENIIAVYIENKADLTSTELKFILDIIFNHLSLYLMNLNGGEQVNINPIVTPVETEEGDLDCLVLLRGEELEDLEITNDQDFTQFSEILNQRKYPINYVLGSYKARGASKVLDVTVKKLYEGTQLEIMGRLEYLFERTKIKVFKEHETE